MKISINQKIFTKSLTNKEKIYIIDKASGEIIDNGGVDMKRTYQPNSRRRSKKMGFMARVKTRIINSRRRKGRKVLSR